MSLHRLLLTTNNHVYAVEYSSAAGSWKFDRLWSRYGMFFGCDWDEKYIYVAGRDAPQLGGKFGEVILRFDRDLKFSDVWYRSRQVLDTHQLCVVGKDLWVTNTFYNCIRIIDRETRIERDYAPLGHSTAPGSFEVGDRNHFNTIRSDGARVYVIANNSVKHGGLRKRRSRSRILAIDPEKLRVQETIGVRGHSAHDLWIEGKIFHTCDSARGVVCSSERETCLALDSWLRGVAIAEDLMFFGKSVWSPRAERAQGTGELLAVDRKTKKIVSRASIPGSGNINDMFLLNRPDLARFHKTPFQE